MAGCGDIRPLTRGPTFASDGNVIVYGCDKNFVYDWINQMRFPSMKTLYLASNPCEISLFDRITCPIFLLDHHYKYKVMYDIKHKIPSTSSRIKLLTLGDVDKLIASHVKEEIVTVDLN